MLMIREDLTCGELRRLARREHDPGVGRRMLAIANAPEGMSRATAARLAGTSMASMASVTAGAPVAQPR